MQPAEVQEPGGVKRRPSAPAGIFRPFYGISRISDTFFVLEITVVLQENFRASC